MQNVSSVAGILLMFNAVVSGATNYGRKMTIQDMSAVTGFSAGD